jgi:hypothetical protein
MNESNPQQTPTPELTSGEQQWSILVWRKAYDAKKALQTAQLSEYLATLPVDNPEGPITEISAQVIIYYVERAIVSWFYVNADLPKDQEDFKERAEFASWNAEQFGDIDTLTLGIEYIFAHPQIDAARFNDSRTSLSDQQMRKILGYIKQTLWRDASPVATKGVKLVSIPLKDWYTSHGKRPERTLEEVVLSEGTLAYHLGCLTDTESLQDDMPEDLEGYYIYALDIQRSARHEGYLEQLRLGIEYVLGNPEIDTKFLMDDPHFCSQDEMHELLRYVWEVIWPNALPIPPGGPLGVSIAKLPPRHPAIIWD